MILLRLSLTITIAVLCSFSIYASDSQYDGFKKKIEIPLAASLPINGFTADYCIKEPRLGTSTLNCEGLSFKLHVPEVCLIKSCGLIVDAHGWLMDARIQDRNTRLSELGGEKGYIVINPQAKKTLQGRSSSAKDDRKVLAIINSVETVFQVMSQRIHLTGFSHGAYMTWRLVCNYSKKLGSVAPIAHRAGNHLRSQRPLRLLVMNN